MIKLIEPYGYYCLKNTLTYVMVGADLKELDNGRVFYILDDKTGKTTVVLRRLLNALR